MIVERRGAAERKGEREDSLRLEMTATTTEWTLAIFSRTLEKIRVEVPVA